MIAPKTDNFRVDQLSVLIVAIEKYGENSQLDMAIEECAELIQAINKCRRSLFATNKIDDLASEIADVEIMIEQLKIIFAFRQSVQEHKNAKIERLKNRLK